MAAASSSIHDAKEKMVQLCNSKHAVLQAASDLGDRLFKAGFSLHEVHRLIDRSFVIAEIEASNKDGRVVRNLGVRLVRDALAFEREDGDILRRAGEPRGCLENLLREIPGAEFILDKPRPRLCMQCQRVWFVPRRADHKFHNDKCRRQHYETTPRGKTTRRRSLPPPRSAFDGSRKNG